jgi:16S rRNA (adenine1518-N6/adenine1519-N6)-dimethyltransferase
VRHSHLAGRAAALAVLQRHGLATRKSLGQHLLIDDNVVGRILDLAAITPDDVVLEVGPGIGTLTVALCDRSAAVVAVERDDTLLPALQEATAGCRVQPSIVSGDAASIDLARLTEPAGSPNLLVANLPYGVAATVVLRYFENLPSLRSATVMVQAEVADRMAASPGRKDYGAYTVKLGLHASVGGRFPVSRSCFLPPPNVDSAVIRLDRVDRPEPPEVLRAAARIADAAFAQRRKTVRNSLRSALAADERIVDALLEDAGIDGGLRAETLPVESFIELGRLGRERFPQL